MNLIDDFMVEMKNSGWNERERLSVLMAGVRTHEKLKEKEFRGIRPFFRKNSLKKKKRKKFKNNKN